MTFKFWALLHAATVSIFEPVIWDLNFTSHLSIIGFLNWIFSFFWYDNNLTSLWIFISKWNLVLLLLILAMIFKETATVNPDFQLFKILLHRIMPISVYRLVSCANLDPFSTLVLAVRAVMRCNSDRQPWVPLRPNWSS